MTDVRPLLPRIRREWDARAGRFIWACDPEPAGRWGLGISQQARYDWRKAVLWCHQENTKQLRMTP